MDNTLSPYQHNYDDNFKPESSANIDKKNKQRKRFRKPRKMQNQNHLKISFTPCASKDISKPKRKKRKGRRLNHPVLRPVGAQVPRAPSNRTQFIMDDHENSSLFVPFNRDNMMIKEKDEQADCDGSSPFSSDWLPYNVADFESAYQSAREDHMMNTNRGDLRKAILSLESKVAIVSELLSASPSRLLAHLQSQLLKLQEENLSLKNQVQKTKHHIEHCHPTSSSSSSSTSSSTSSSSTSSSTESDSDDSSHTSTSGCSDPNCNACVDETQEKADEEKENTCPSVSSPSVSLQEPEQI